MNNNGVSIIFPDFEGVEYKQMPDSAFHDLGLDSLCREFTSDTGEQRYIKSIISQMTADVRVAQYRQNVFADILKLPELRKSMTELFEKIESIRNLGTVRMESDEKLGFWYLMRRLNELDEYVRYVEEMKACLEDERISSQGLRDLREYIDELYNKACFAAMKKDIAELKEKAGNIKSVTLGVNVNERFEAVSMGLVSINSKQFKKSGIVSNFANAVASHGKIHDSTEWNGDMHYQQVDMNSGGKIASIIETVGSYTALRSNPFVAGNMRSTIVNAPEGDGVNNTTYFLDNVLNRILDSLVKKLRDTLSKYADIAILNLSRLIPEFVYYVRLAEFVDRYRAKGFVFCEPVIGSDGDRSMNAKRFYNLRLALSVGEAGEIVDNDLIFDNEHMVYILTGANRGGKTTVTQAVGQLFALAQGGAYVPAASFEYKPVDNVYTHFPSDEDKTIDLGRLGEECVRFKQIYGDCTGDSLLLLNESFSTTSFEEGYYIARDSVRAILKKGVRTIYNTHMHKLAADVCELNEAVFGVKASSLIVKSDGGNRSFKVEAAPPEGMSYARDIAQKYGVTYEMLIGESENK